MSFTLSINKGISLYQQIKMVIADDHPLFRQALSLMLSTQFPQASILEAKTIPELEKLFNENTELDLLLLDLDIPGALGFNHLIHFRHQYPNTAIVIISGYENKDTITKAMTHGAAGFIPKSTPVEEMVSAIKEIFKGKLWIPGGEFDPSNNKHNSDVDDKIASLTPQQHKILMMFADGMLNKQIAYDLGLSESTIKSHASTIFLKLGVRNRTQAVILLNELQVVNTAFN